MRASEFLFPPTIARCQHIKVNGVQCGSPALKNRKLCHFHQRWQQGRIQLNADQARRSRYSLNLPILEDANSIQVALMQGMRLLLTNQVDHRTAALLFYALQTASSNLSRTTFEPRPQQVVIDPRGVSDTSLGDDAWYKEEFEEEDTVTDDETSDESPATVNLQAMADCIGEDVGTGLRPVLSGRHPKPAVRAAVQRRKSSILADAAVQRRKSSILGGAAVQRGKSLILGGAAVHRCVQRADLNTALAAAGAVLTSAVPRPRPAIRAAVFLPGRSTNTV
jgi:hypothetical protein